MNGIAAPALPNSTLLPVVAPPAIAVEDRMFRALADATRRDIVRRTLGAEATVSELASAYSMTFAGVQKHITVLEAAGLVSKTARGRERIVRGEPRRIREAQALLDRFEAIWRSRIERLDALLADN